MKKIVGTNLGNWLVLEKWMNPEFFAGTDADDEVWLNRKVEKEILAPKMKEHRDTYVTEEDFEDIAAHGMNSVRIPVPFFIWGDREPFSGCIEHLDLAFAWAEKYGLKILIDLHTVPGSQNGYDNGGLTGVCKWHKDKKEVGFALSVLERLAKRYGQRDGLLGIEVLNEPISFLVYRTAPSTGKAEDKQEAKGSGYVPMGFLKAFYRKAYQIIRPHLAEDKIIVFHDGFRPRAWKDFFVKEKMKNVMIDTHIYIFAMEMFCPIHKPWVYKLYVKYNEWVLKRMQKYTPVIVGEWCLSNKYAVGEKDCSKQKEKFNEICRLQLEAWSKTAGFFYWNYQLGRDKDVPMDENWKNSWDLTRCWNHEWFTEDYMKELFGEE